MARRTASNRTWNLPPIRARSPLHLCRYAGEVVGRRCSTQASRTSGSEMAWACAMAASSASSTPAKPEFAVTGHTRRGRQQGKRRNSAWFRIFRFRVTQACGKRRPVRAGLLSERCPVWEAARLPVVKPAGAEGSQAQQGEPVWMALAGHQLPRALALALGVPAAQEAAVVQEEPQQVQV